MTIAELLLSAVETTRFQKMRISPNTRWFSSLLGAAVLVTAGLSQADEEYDVAVSQGSVKVTTKPGWHINKDYPWKLVAGDKKIDKSQFKLSEHSASVDAPKGPAKLKGAVCFGEAQCKPFEKELTVP